MFEQNFLLVCWVCFLECLQIKAITMNSIIEEKDNSDVSPEWVFWKGLYINQDLFLKGLLVISSTNRERQILTSKNSFSFHNAHFAFGSVAHPHKKVKKTIAFAQKLVDFSNSFERVFEPENYTRPTIQPIDEETGIIVNESRHEEVFMPIVFNPETDNSTAVYMYPWTSKDLKNVNFAGCTQFVSAGCLFGGSMIGETTSGDAIQFINHHLEWTPDICISAIKYNRGEANPFEIVVFSECEKICWLIDTFVQQGHNKHLLYHIPAYDYILFCVNLFLHGNMTYAALDSFVRICIDKRDEYITNITEICASHGILVNFCSPFDNVFNALDLTTHNITDTLLDYLQIENISTFTDVEELARREAALVDTLKDKLFNNDFDRKQQQVWQDFFVVDHLPLDNLESLFKMANAVVIATAAHGRHHLETCVLLPLSEKQIPVGYHAFSQKCSRDQAAKSSAYPVVLNLTVFDPVITYTPNSENGLLFYCNCFREIVATLVQKLSAVKNFLSNGKSVKEFLEEKESPAIRPDSIRVITEYWESMVPLQRSASAPVFSKSNNLFTLFARSKSVSPGCTLIIGNKDERQVTL